VSQATAGKAGNRGLRSGMSGPATNQDHLLGLLNWLLPDDGIFANVKFHGNTSWSARQVVIQALCWAWSASKNLTDSFHDSRKWSCRLLGSCPFDSYTGFMGAMTRWDLTFLNLLGPLLHARMKEIGGSFWSYLQWVPIAFDGSRTTVPRTKSNEKAYCAPNYGGSRTAEYRRKKRRAPRRGKAATAAKRKKKRVVTRARIKAAQAARRQKMEQKTEPQSAPQAPQVWITMLWHMRLRLPWMWRLGPSNSNEREHVLDMLETGDFPKNALFCGDAGFIGFPFWSAILKRKYQFLVRVGANVHLLSQSADFRMEDDGQVLCWPVDMMKTNHPPLRLRLVKVVSGKTNIWLLTSVLDSRQLSKDRVLKLYKMRWGIEVEFRGLKQTLDHGKLGSRRDVRVLVELNWSILAMAIAELFALKEQLSGKRSPPPAAPPDPIKRSLAQTMRALRNCLSELHSIPQSNNNLITLLRTAVVDNYNRTSFKAARHRKINPDKKPLGNPNIREMLDEEKARLKSISERQAI
jgi:hypothetical protein